MQPLDTSAWIKILLVFVLAVVLGLSPGSRQYQDLLHQSEDAKNNSDFISAAQLVAEAARIVTWRSDLWEIAGDYAAKGNDLELTIAYFKMADSQGKLSVSGRIKLAAAYYQIAQIDQAINTWQDALALGAKPEKVYPALLDAYVCKQDYDGAIKILNELVRIHPNQAQYHYQLGLYLAASDPIVAIDFLDKAEKLDSDLLSSCQQLLQAIMKYKAHPDSAYLLLESGRTLASIGEWELATQAFRQATRIRPDYADAWAFLAEALQHLTDIEYLAPGQHTYPQISLNCPAKYTRSYDTAFEVKASLKRALELDPLSITANVFNALYYQRQNRYDISLTYLQTAVDVEPENPILYLELASVQALTGDLESALNSYQKGVQVAPNNSEYKKFQLQFQIDSRYQLEETALPLARQSVRLYAEDAQFMDLMGQILELLEDQARAKMYYLRAIELDANYAPAYLHLASFYIKSERIDDARYYLYKAYLIDPGTEVGAQAGYLLRYYFP